MNKRFYRADWQRILEDQKLQGISDEDCAKTHGVTILRLQHWRRLVGGRRLNQPQPLVEVKIPSRSLQALIISFPNGITLSVPDTWPGFSLGTLAKELVALC